MQKAKVDIFIALFCYGGNGGVSSIIPEIAIWMTKNYHEMKKDERIGRIAIKTYSDTPIYMTRNRSVRDAKALGYDMILMLDSDNAPDAYLGHEADAKPFWETSFAFAYERLMQGLPTVIAAPYCGPPPNPCPPPGIIDHGEVPYLFQWTNTESDAPDCQFRIDILTRLEASRLKGIYPVAALPTGVCLFTLNSFEGLKKPYFRYEMNEDGSEKRSTEDVVATRDISLYWMMTKGITAIWANCDAWAFHHKPKKVGKPKMVYLEAIGQEMRDAILTQRSALDSVQYVDFTKGEVPQGEIKPLKANEYQLNPNYKYEITPSVCPDTPPPPADIDISRLPRRGDVLRHDQDYVYLTDEELEEAKQLIEMEQGSMEDSFEFADAQVHDPDYTTVTTANTPEHDAVLRSNGDGLTHKMIGNRKVAVIGQELGPQEVESIQGLTTWLAKDNPLEVAVAHPGTGQAAAAILADLPPGSHLYALDSVNTYQFKTDYADQFVKSFQSELESGRVQADLYGRKFPWPHTQHSLDMVFIERSLNAVKLKSWMEHVRPGGIVAGLGYQNGGVKRLIDEMAEHHSFKAIGDVWAITV
jgi:hypothetical protein